MRLLAARMLQLVGWAGVAGIALMLTASAITALAWAQRSARVESVADAAPHPDQAVTQNQLAERPTLALSEKSEVPLLVTQIAQTANANGLTWPAAEYRIVAATQEKPASLEIRCVLRGSYPKVRSMLAQLINAIPGFSVRELSMSRASSEVAQVEAKLVMAVFLRDEASAEPRREPEAKR